MADKNRWDGFRLLHEEVAAIDGFKHKTHQEVADSLAEIILRDESGATVGVEGSWGGGKSTVINILKKKLKGKAIIFLFDAWAHEESCLRRVFLESVIGTTLNAIADGELKGNIKERLSEIGEIIAGRRNSHTITSTRKPTWTGLLAVVVSFLVALEVALVSICKTDKGIDCGVMYTIAGVFILIAIIIGWRALCLKRAGESIKSAKTWALVEVKAEETIKKEVSEDEERTSIEFEKYFSEIMELISSKNPDTKLIIAIDNLDRIDGSRSLTLWSILQTFLQKRSDDIKDNWFRKLWVLVPYDADGLERVWSPDGSSEGKAKAKSFMDKAFQVRVEVPRPVMADWQGFAKDQISELFIDDCPKEAEDVLRILEVTRNGLSNIPTPREIKNYVNQVAVFRNQFCKEIDTKTIAYYAIKRFLDEPRLSTDSIRQGLLDKSFPMKKDRPYLPYDVDEQLCGIIFGVSPKDGQQLLLEPKIADALENYKFDILKETMDEHENGAWMAFDSYVSHEGLWKDASDIRKFLTSVSCVFKCNYDELRLRTLADVCHDYLQRLCGEQSENLKAFFDSDDEQLDITVSAVKELSRLLEKRILNLLNEALIKALEVIVAEGEIEKSQLGKVSDRLFMAFEEKSRNKSVIKTFTADKLRQFCSTLPEQQYELSKWIVPMASIVTEINAAIQQDVKIPPYLGRVVKYVIESGIKVDWTATIDSVKKHILFNNGHSAENIPTRRALDILLFIVGTGDTKYIEQIKPLFADGAFYNFVSVKPEERAQKALLLLACCDPTICSNIHPTSQVGNSQVGINSINAVLTSESDDDARTVLELINEFGIESCLREFKYETPNKIFDIMIGYSMKSDDYVWFNHDVEDPLDSIWLYSEHLNVSSTENKEEKLKTYMEYWDSRFDIISILREKGFTAEDFEYCSKLIKYYLSKDFERLKGTVIEHLSKLSESEFYLDLNNVDFRTLLISIDEHDCHQYLGLDFYKGLSRLLVGKGDEARDRDKFVSSITQDSLGALVRAVKPEYKRKLSKAVVGALKAIEDTDTDKLKPYYEKVNGICHIEDFSDALVDDMAWKGAVDGKLDLLIIVAELVERNKQSDNVWLPSKEVKDSMVEPLQKLFQSTTDSNVKYAITIVARYYDVQLIQPEAESSDDSDDSPAGE